MGKESAGLLLFRRCPELQVFLVHPGGPFFIKKDDGVWTIPKGEFNADEQPLQAAKREFMEETGIEVNGHFLPLSTIKQKGGKIVYAWALEHHVDETICVSNTFTMEWPPHSNNMQVFPEIDRAAWFSIAEAKRKINAAQSIWLNQLVNEM